MQNVFVAEDLQYFEAPEGSNCPINQMITSESMCKHAVSQIKGLIYRFPVHRTDRHAGCYHGKGRQGHFNKITDPSATTISYKEHHKGICKKVI